MCEIAPQSAKKCKQHKIIIYLSLVQIIMMTQLTWYYPTGLLISMQLGCCLVLLYIYYIYILSHSRLNDVVRYPSISPMISGRWFIFSHTIDQTIGQFILFIVSTTWSLGCHPYWNQKCYHFHDIWWWNG